MAKECNDCPIMDLVNLHDAMEKRVLRKIPPEVREPLLEAKQQLMFAFWGFIKYNLREEEAARRHNAKSRHIGLD